MSNTILVIAELRNSALRKVTFEAISAAKQLLQQQSGSIHCYLSAPENNALIQQAAEQLLSYGADHVHLASCSYVLDDLPPLHTLVQDLQPAFIIAGHTAYGRDLAPRLAALLNRAYLSDVTSIQISEDVTFTRPIYSGKAYETKRFAGAAPYIVTIRPNNCAATEVFDTFSHSFTIEDSPRNEGKIHEIEATTPPLNAIVKEVVRRARGKIDLTEAEVIVAGGRGVRGSEGFALLQQLADVLGGAVGASRGACDAGYCDYSLQIGQTGKIVTPQLYIACGISGAIQHLAGMSQARTIIAINKDPGAAIFSVADYGIVGDLFEIVPLLRDELLALQKT